MNSNKSVVHGLLVFLSLTFLWPVTGADGSPKRSPDEVLVVYNRASPISRSVAYDYAGKRNINNMLSVECADSAVDTDAETISMPDYTKLIEKPVRDYLAVHADIQFIVLTKGVPIRISGAETGERSLDSPADSNLFACVDNHLAGGGWSDLPGSVKISITGSGATGSTWLNRYWNAREPFSHAKFGGYLVTRLDGYTEDDAKALVRRALAAEQGLTDGKVLLDVQPSFGLGDKAAEPSVLPNKTILEECSWSTYNADMQHAYDILISRKIPAEIDLTETFIGKRSNLLGYFSFGSNDGKYSDDAYQSLTFAPGSIADTAVSTSGRTFLPTSGGQSLIVDLIAHGVTGVEGCTDEPLLQGIGSPTIELDRFTSGYTLAESFYAGARFIGWQNIMIGDPLCCPYPGKKQ